MTNINVLTLYFLVELINFHVNMLANILENKMSKIMIHSKIQELTFKTHLVFDLFFMVLVLFHIPYFLKQWV